MLSLQYAPDQKFLSILGILLYKIKVMIFDLNVVPTFSPICLLRSVITKEGKKIKKDAKIQNS